MSVYRLQRYLSILIAAVLLNLIAFREWTHPIAAILLLVFLIVLLLGARASANEGRLERQQPGGEG